MKTVIVLVNLAVLALAFGEELENDKNEGAAGTPWLPFIGSFPFFVFSGSRRPAIVRDRIKATKTEYREITKKTTIHPMCYVMHQNRGPCLPRRSNDEDERNDEIIESEMSDLMRPVKEVYTGERDGKYLRFGKPVLDASEISPARIATEYVSTTTVLVTRLEKYMDRRVTATMIAVNCQPVDKSMEECPKHGQKPILDLPIFNNLHPNSIIITPVKPKSEPLEEEIDQAVEAVRAAAESVLSGNTSGLVSFDQIPTRTGNRNTKVNVQFRLRLILGDRERRRNLIIKQKNGIVPVIIHVSDSVDG